MGNVGIYSSTFKISMLCYPLISLKIWTILLQGATLSKTSIMHLRIWGGNAQTLKGQFYLEKI